MTFTKQEKTALEKLARELVKSDLADGENLPTRALMEGAISGLVSKLEVEAVLLTHNAQELRDGFRFNTPDHIAISSRLQDLLHGRERVTVAAAALIVFADTLNQELRSRALAPKSAGRPSAGAEEERS